MPVFPVPPTGGTLVNITISPLQFDDLQGTANENFPDGAVFTDYEVNNHYEKDRHIYMMGISSPDGFDGDSAAFVQLANPTMLLISDWTACRIGVKPKLPDPRPTDPRLVLLDEHWVPNKVVNGPDGTSPLYRISGTYVYGFRKVNPQTIQDLVIPRPPWLMDNFIRTVNESDLEQGLTNRQGPVNPGFFI